MAEETQKVTAGAPAAEEVVVVSDVSKAEKTISEKELPPAPEPEPEVPEKPAEEVVEAEKEKPAADEEKITESASFKEETNVAAELPDPQKKALDELKQLVQEALNKHEFTATPAPAKEEEKPAEPAAPAVEEAEEKAPSEEQSEAKPEEKSETKPEEKSEAAAETPADAPPAKAAEEPAKPEPEAIETKEEEKAPAPPAPPAEETSEQVVVAEVIEKVTAVDDAAPRRWRQSKKQSSPSPLQQRLRCRNPLQKRQRRTRKDSSGGASSAATRRGLHMGNPTPRRREKRRYPPQIPESQGLQGQRRLHHAQNTVRWRKEFGIESLLEEDFGTDLDKVVFMHGFDKEGHPVCYNAYGEFQNKELYQNTFSDEGKRQKFLRWRIQFLEKSIRKLDFKPDGICTFVQVNDLKNSPGPFKRELRQATNQALQLLQDNYPEFVAKQVFINVPWWYLAFYRMISPFFTQRTKSKFVFAGPSKSAETLFKYTAPEQVPVQYGGLSRDGEQEFSAADTATEEIIKAAGKHTVEFLVSEACTLVWEARVVGWEVSYGAEFVPSAEGGYTVIVQKSRKIAPVDETVIGVSFKVGEAGKVVLNFDNQTSKKKKLLYRSKVKASD